MAAPCSTFGKELACLDVVDVGLFGHTLGTVLQRGLFPTLRLCQEGYQSKRKERK